MVALVVGVDAGFVFRVAGLTFRVALVVFDFKITKAVVAVRELTKLKVAVVVVVVLVVFVFGGIGLYPKETEMEKERYNNRYDRLYYESHEAQKRDKNKKNK